MRLVNATWTNAARLMSFKSRVTTRGGKSRLAFSAWESLVVLTRVTLHRLQWTTLAEFSPLSLSLSRRRSSIPQFSFHVGWTKLEKVTRPRKCNRRSALPSNLVKITFRIITTACAFPGREGWVKVSKGSRWSTRNLGEGWWWWGGKKGGRGKGRKRERESGHENIKIF